MILPDTSLLVYAYNADAAEHTTANAWLHEIITSGEPIAFTWSTLAGFLRISTNRRAMPKPASVDDAISRVNDWLVQPSARVIRPGETHWRILQELLRAVNVGGDLVTDAHLAALAIEHDCELHSADTDFARFPGLRWRNPLRR
jgi:toxin-antitoxin system PIN domain toxin